MDKQQMLAKIYEVIADKTLSPGCKIIFKTTPLFTKDKKMKHFCGKESEVVFKNDSLYFIVIDRLGYTVFLNEESIREMYEDPEEYKLEYHIYKIIGHPVMIGDVLDWIEHKDEHLFMHNSPSYIFDNCYSLLFKLWYKLRLPIDQQSDKCIKYVYDLLPPQS